MAQEQQRPYNQGEIRYLTPLSVDTRKKKYCRFKRSGIKYIDTRIPNS